MRYTRIEIEGRAGNYAALSRRAGDEFFTVEILLPGGGGGGCAHRINAGDEGERWSMAERLQQTLEGYRGCGGDIREYARAIDLIAGA